MGVLRMKGVVRVLSTYSSDLFGINSVLYELGGLVVMHDASGCNSTYNTHDEPRWYTQPSMVFISGLLENDAILGNDEKLIADVCAAAAETNPNFISLSAAMIPHVMGIDLTGIAKVIEKRSSIPTFGFNTNAMDSYVVGGNMVYEKFITRLCPDVAPDAASGAVSDPALDAVSGAASEKTPHKKISVNLLGVTPLDFSVVGNVEALRELLEKNDIAVNCCMSMGMDFAQIADLYKADVNVVLSSLAIKGALLLEEKYHTPYITSIPIGKYGTEAFISAIKHSASNKMPPVVSDTPLPLSKEDKSTYSMQNRIPGDVYLIGEPVFTASLRTCLEHDMNMIGVRIICPTEYSCALLRDGDVMTKEEEDIETCLADASLVLADPLYRRALPFHKSVKFVDIAHEAYSGRMYRSHIPVFISENFSQWIEERIRHQNKISTNDIMLHNVAYKRHWQHNF